MKQLVLLSIATSLAAGLAAQSNIVNGLNGRLTVIDQLTNYGRRGPAYPNGEAGMAMLNEMCNPGSVTIPWFAAMQPNHPKFGFIITRVAGDKIEQINEWSFCKHAFLSINTSGPCGSCINPGTGSVMGINCADVYGPGNNASREWLGPPQEIDPWLGTWNPVGSYFDIGDPSQAGYPAPADGVRSLSQSIFDNVDNRVTVKEIDFTTPNASYYYGLQLIHQGEALANRDDNLAHRGFNPNWNGSTWSYANNAAAQQYGTILNRWPGASVDVGHNGNDDGRFYVAVKTTSLGGGNYHYEYAVHNVDNSRAGGTFRLPVAASATITNITFGDIDNNAGNDWTGARVGNEVVFTAPMGNFLEWNTIYNFGFDADFVPGLDTAKLDEARPGSGALWVEVPTTVPGGQTIPTLSLFGNGCAGSIELPTPPCAQLNPTGGTLSNELFNGEFAFRVQNAGAPIASIDIWTASTGGTVNVPVRVYLSSGTPPTTTAVASTTMTVGPTPGFYTATFTTPFSPGTSFYYVGMDISAQNVFNADLTGGSSTLAYSRSVAAPTWTLAVRQPAYFVTCDTPPMYKVPAIGNNGLAVLGSSYDLTLSEALDSTVAVLVSGLSDTSFMGAPLPVVLPGTPGCNLLVAPEALDAVLTTPIGTASSPIAVPNSAGLLGLAVFHQWAVLDAAANSLGITTSNAARLTVGN